MMSTFDLESLLFSLLQKSPVSAAITGGIYLGDDRPDDSTKEDIIINTIDLTQDYLPQVATSNVNIYVPDKNVMIAGKQQLKANRIRLKELSAMVIETIRCTNITGLIMTASSQTLLSEPKVNQHYVNIRVDWNIQTN